MNIQEQKEGEGWKEGREEVEEEGRRNSSRSSTMNTEASEVGCAADEGHDRPAAGRQCLADRRIAGGQEPRDPPRHVRDRARGEPPDPGVLRAVSAWQSQTGPGGRGSPQGPA